MPIRNQFMKASVKVLCYISPGSPAPQNLQLA